MKNEKMEVYKKLFPYLKPYGFLLLISLFLAMVSVLSSVWIPKVIGQTIDAMIGVGEVQFSIVTNGLLWILVLALISMVSQYVMSLCHNHIAYGMVKSLRDDVFIHLSKNFISISMSFCIISIGIFLCKSSVKRLAVSSSNLAI